MKLYYIQINISRQSSLQKWLGVVGWGFWLNVFKMNTLKMIVIVQCSQWLHVSKYPSNTSWNDENKELKYYHLVDARKTSWHVNCILTLQDHYPFKG